MQSAPIQQQQTQLPTPPVAFYNQRWLLETIAGQMAYMRLIYPMLMCNPVKFKKMEHDTTYKRLSEIFDFIQGVKEVEWYQITERLRQSKQAQGQQAAMF